MFLLCHTNMWHRANIRLADTIEPPLGNQGFQKAQKRGKTAYANDPTADPQAASAKA
ncbi:hypothetical protein [Ascidiaceihabitans sp.]|uniref:hypothetical protein n=1 Tax=Ascidiaceihabitans sp. TaxID=1872644 RepID=UPI0032987E1F